MLGTFLMLTSGLPVYSALWLIFVFLNAAGLFVLLSAEFLAMIFVIVYIGAVAVLFLFVVMMLVSEKSSETGMTKGYKGSVILLGVLFGCEIIFLIGGWTLKPWPSVQMVGTAEALGDVLYTRTGSLFQISGFIMLTAMVGALVLAGVPPKTRKRLDSKKSSQDVCKKDRLKLYSLALNEGVKDDV